jgi:TolB-like protein
MRAPALVPLIGLALCVPAGAQEAGAQQAGTNETVETVGAVEAECNVLVMDLKGKALAEADAELPEVLTEALVAEVSEVSGCKVVSEADIASMLQLEATKASCGEDIDSCLAEVGAAFGAERAVSGTVGRIGEDFQLTARLLDVTEGSVVERAEQTVKGGPEGLQVAAKNLGRDLFGAQPLAPDAPVAAASPDAAGGPSFALIGGGTLAGLGALLVAGGAAAAGVAEWRMSDPTSTDKGEMQLLGLVGLGGAGVGALAGIGGGALLVVGMVE